MSIKAMKLALEALEQVDPYIDQLVDYSSTAAEWPLNNAPRNVTQAITALRQAIEQAEQAQPVAFGPVAKRRVFDYIRGAYDLGYNDARNAKAVPGDGAPGYKGREVEADHGGALLHALESISPPPRQPEQCTWSQVDSEHTPDTWEASCGAMWTFTEGGPKENDMSYCPKCGNPVIEAAHGIKKEA